MDKKYENAAYIGGLSLSGLSFMLACAVLFCGFGISQEYFKLGLIITLLCFSALTFSVVMAFMIISKRLEQIEKKNEAEDQKKDSKDFLKLALTYGANSNDEKLKKKLREKVAEVIDKFCDSNTEKSQGTTAPNISPHRDV
ncbi:MAG: hypothetical protein LBM78_05050 [Clostridiales bacterium]|jgi:uncharacterized membrane protein|nr:hypothetical protein [Clostridiales bacterium]